MVESKLHSLSSEEVIFSRITQIVAIKCVVYNFDESNVLNYHIQSRGTSCYVVTVLHEKMTKI